MNKLAISTILLLLLTTNPMTEIPIDSNSVRWIQPHGDVDHGGGNIFFHDGIDFGTVNGGKFFSTVNGIVSNIELNTGKGWPGTNYRIMIQVDANIILDYHFEIGGDAPLSQRQANVLVALGDPVTAGQHIANLIYGDDANAADVAHVHWGIYGNVDRTKCPLDYFSTAAAQSFEALYDSGIEKRPAYREDLCN
jgi:murein DD-endopeptidase MepM/ murein hydrolase activator NlpD